MKEQIISHLNKVKLPEYHQISAAETGHERGEVFSNKNQGKNDTVL